MNQFEQYEQQKIVNLLGLRAFPRSVGMLVGAIILLLYKEPIAALLMCIAAWLITFLIKSLMHPDIVGTYFWSCCSLPVNAIGAYPIRWFLYIVMVIIALVMGSPFGSTLLIMGGLLGYDLIIVFTRGS